MNELNLRSFEYHKQEAKNNRELKQYEVAGNHYKYCALYIQLLGDHHTATLMYIESAQMYLYNKLFDETITVLVFATIAAEKCPDFFHYRAKCFVNIGHTYRFKKNYEKSIEAFMSAYHIYESLELTGFAMEALRYAADNNVILGQIPKAYEMYENIASVLVTSPDIKNRTISGQTIVTACFCAIFIHLTADNLSFIIDHLLFSYSVVVPQDIQIYLKQLVNAVLIKDTFLYSNIVDSFPKRPSEGYFTNNYIMAQIGAKLNDFVKKQ